MMTQRRAFQVMFAMVVVLVGVLAAFGPAYPRGVDVPVADPSLSLENGVLLHDGLPFTGRVVAAYDEGGLKARTEYVNGLRHGRALGWFANGQLAWERTYVRGLEDGTHRGWWEDSSPRFVYEFRGGLLQGQALEWYRGGRTYRDFTYEDGQESGRQRMWFPDGTLRANYVIRDGRRYGLMGSKGCVTEGTEVPS